MIAGISGTLNRFGPSRVYVEAAGVEYEINVPLSVFESLQARTKTKKPEIRLFTYHQFAQDGQRLFGFLTEGQRELFVAVLSVKGIGPTLALSILSHLDAVSLLRLCAENNVAALCRIPRIGKGTAETIIFEINRKRDKWQKLLITTEARVKGLLEPGAAGAAKAADDMELAVQALLGLGYKEIQVRGALAKVEKEADFSAATATAADLIQHALRVI